MLGAEIIASLSGNTTFCEIACCLGGLCTRSRKRGNLSNTPIYIYRAKVGQAEALAWLQACVQGMFQLKDDSTFKQHLRDFLVQTKSFADKNNADLYAEEAAQQREVC